MGMHCDKQTRSKQSEKKRMRDWDRIRKELPERKEKRKRERERERGATILPHCNVAPINDDGS